jgi:hypothetical protein
MNMGPPSNSGPQTMAMNVIEVNPVASYTTLTSSANPSAFDQTITFSVRVEPLDPAVIGTPTGNVTFMDGMTNLGTRPLNASAQATFATSILSIGTHEITAVYNGDANFAASTADSAGTCTQTVNGGFANGRVWVDDNGNGLQDTGEVGREGVTVLLLNVFAIGTPDKATTTDAYGRYNFSGLDPNTWYSIQVVKPAEYRFTFFQSGNNPAIDSDTGSTDGTTNSFQVAAGTVMTRDSGLVSLTGLAINTIRGPGAVPGNSTYTYLGTLTGFSWGDEIVSPISPPEGTVTPGLTRTTYDSASDTTLESYDITFGNSTPADIILKGYINGVVAASKEIYVVQVSVAFGDYLNYSSGPVDGGFGSLPANNAYLKGVSSGVPFGAEWAANVTLTGPGNNLGVDQIHAGFIQHINIQSWRGRYLGSDVNNPAWLVSNAESQTYLDMMPDGGGLHQPDSTYLTGPWYDRQVGAVFDNATAASNSKTIHSGDHPGLGTPLTFQQATGPAIGNPNQIDANFRRLDRVVLNMQFSLDVAASTADTSNGANNSYWGEQRAAWTFNGTGNIGAYDIFTNNFPWIGDGAFTNGAASWSAIVGPAQEDRSGTIFNQTGPTLAFIQTA